MRISRQMRLERALEHLEKEKEREERSMRAMEGINITEVIIVRNKKRMYMAELDQMIRNIKSDMESGKDYQKAEAAFAV